MSIWEVVKPNRPFLDRRIGRRTLERLHRHERGTRATRARADRDEREDMAGVSSAVVSRHRDDIQGLRAVAVLLVVLAHAGIGFLKGGYIGVDVFFVLSGFLITGILLSGARKRGYVSLFEFYTRRAKRILPAAALTLVVTDIAAYYLLNFVRARQAVSDSIWAAFFSANVDFARRGTDYFSQGQPPSPIQHYWSLSVEEQFYLVWPTVLSLALFGAIVIRRAPKGGPRTMPPRSLKRLFLVILVVTSASLVWSIYATKSHPAATYFSTPARGWELGLGAALAIAAPTLTKLPHYLGVTIGWCGLIAIGCAAVGFSAGTPFPGSAALLPTVGAVLVIAAGIREHRGRWAPSRVLSVAPMRYVGDRSYAYYLWHWPVLVIAGLYVGHRLTVGVNLMLLIGAFGLSIISYRAFEDPLRRMRWPGPTGALLWPASAALVVVVSVVVLGSIDGKAARLETAAAAARPKSIQDPTLAAYAAQNLRALPAVIAATRAAQRNAPIPSPLTPAVGSLLKDIYGFPEGCAPKDGATSSRLVCHMGDTSSQKTLVAMGDSHIYMWMPTILRMAQQDGWLVIPLPKSACTPGSWLRYPKKPECPGWYRWAMKQVAAIHPDVTLVTGDWGIDTDPVGSAKTIAVTTKSLKKVSSSVIVIGDAPHQTRQPVDCLLARHATMKTCTAKVHRAALWGDMTIAANAKRQHVGFMSTRGWFCSRVRARTLTYWCPLVINKTITHRDLDHVSTTYALELASPFRAAFRRALFQ
jgi:peptidoglycan/LPS O-acetylase OafA/YrhL